MTFDLRAILIFAVTALLYAGWLPPQARGWTLLIGSVVAIYWLQPPLPIRFSDFVLPTITLLITSASWWFARGPEQSSTRDDRITLLAILATVSLLSLNRFIETDYRLTPSRPPDPFIVAVALISAAVLFAGMTRLLRHGNQRYVLTGVIFMLIGIFVLLKTEALAVEISRTWRSLTGQDTAIANSADLNWLGFSYVAFRLLHTLRDRQAGILPALSLREYVTYVIFAPAYTAGPIDRAERFAIDYRALPGLKGLDADRWMLAGARIMLGLFKKFAIADLLAQGLSLNTINAAQINSTPGLWALLYGYALRLYFDFSGYTDIAIGIGVLFGLQMPENFNRPYLRTSITAFWQSWHMTLSNWARFYVFTPLSRWLLMREHRLSPTLIVLCSQLATMITIGVWHGVTLNFVAWGVWHGIGLFIHKQWSDHTRKWYRGLNNKPGQKRVWSVLTWFVTLQFVVVGWLWFALPDVGQSMQLMLRLFGSGQ